MSILLTEPQDSSHDGKGQIVITKGALKNVLSVCTKVEMGDGKIVGIVACYIITAEFAKKIFYKIVNY
ncbi:MAG: hypothetical protein JJE18_06835 [Eubacteriaceae bacterium]|nr:hypothetical protein [Eubacteriaceae bacterium]